MSDLEKILEMLEMIRDEVLRLVDLVKNQRARIEELENQLCALHTPSKED
jgi:hypothetical protein